MRIVQDHESGNENLGGDSLSSSTSSLSLFGFGGGHQQKEIEKRSALINQLPSLLSQIASVLQAYQVHQAFIEALMKVIMIHLSPSKMK